MPNTPTSVHPMLAALERGAHRLVLAESCTGGMVCASLAQIPGISEWLCGSLVTYRASSKTAWLAVPESLIQQCTTESPEVTQAMCCEALQKTPEATIAAAITGHLGPNAPTQIDGIVFISIARRINGAIVQVTCVRRELHTTERIARQVEASQLVTKLILSSI